MMKKQISLVMVGILVLGSGQMQAMGFGARVARMALKGCVAAAAIGGAAYAQYRAVTDPVVDYDKMAERVLSIANKQRLSAMTENVVLNEESVVQKKGLEPKGQTDAYLSSPNRAALVKLKYGKTLDEYKKQIDQMLQRERELADTHYVFYHGASGRISCGVDMQSEMYSLAHMAAPHKNFFHLRDEDVKSLDFPMVRDFFYSPILSTYFHYGDSIPETSRFLLSVNYSLFGNTTCEGSNTFSYYLSGAYGTRGGAFHLAGMPTSDTLGVLFQIFIPKNKVDECTYDSMSGGYVCESWWKNPQVSKVIELYKKPGSFWSDIFGGNTLDRQQARIYLGHECMHNPDSGVIMYRYHTGEQNLSEAEYQAKEKERLEKIKPVAQKAMTELIKKELMFRKCVSGVVKPALITGTPIEKIIAKVAAQGKEVRRVIKPEYAKMLNDMPACAWM